MFSGFQISQASFLWSQETWGLLASNKTPRLRKMKLVLVIFGAGLLGLAVGPASAGLMVPRLRVSSVGSTPFWLNATKSSLFPSSLDDTMVHPSCANISGKPSLNHCPSSRWEALAGFAGSNGGLRGPPGSNWDLVSAEYPIAGSSPHSAIDLTGAFATRTMYRTDDPHSCEMTTQHAALAEALFAISQMWASSWARFLNPVTDDSGNTVFGSLASSFNGDLGQHIAEMDPADQGSREHDDISSAYERILAALVANGLANVGIDCTLQGNLSTPTLCAIQIQGNDTVCNWSKSYLSNSTYFSEPPEAKGQDWKKWEVKHSVQGLAYSMENDIIIFYMVVLVIYATVVTIYSFYVLWKRQSSSPWRSVSELTTLALTSPQPPQDLVELDSTSAGIFGLGAFEKNVRVVAVADEKTVEEGTEELQLVFGKEMPPGYKKLVLNEEYGATR